MQTVMIKDYGYASIPGPFEGWEPLGWLDVITVNDRWGWRDGMGPNPDKAHQPENSLGHMVGSYYLKNALSFKDCFVFRLKAVRVKAKSNPIFAQTLPIP